MRTCSLPRGPPGPRPPDPGTDTRCHDHALTDLGTGTQAQRRRLGRQSHSLTGTVSRPPRQSHPECHIQPPPHILLEDSSGFPGSYPTSAPGLGSRSPLSLPQPLPGWGAVPGLRATDRSPPPTVRTAQAFPVWRENPAIPADFAGAPTGTHCARPPLGPEPGVVP